MGCGPRAADGLTWPLLADLLLQQQQRQLAQLRLIQAILYAQHIFVI